MIEDKSSLDIATEMWGSEGRDDKRSGTWGGALEGQVFATGRRFKSAHKGAGRAHSKGKRKYTRYHRNSQDEGH